MVCPKLRINPGHWTESASLGLDHIADASLSQPSSSSQPRPPLRFSISRSPRSTERVRKPHRVPWLWLDLPGPLGFRLLDSSHLSRWPYSQEQGTLRVPQRHRCQLSTEAHDLVLASCLVSPCCSATDALGFVDSDVEFPLLCLLRRQIYI